MLGIPFGNRLNIRLLVNSLRGAEGYNYVEHLQVVQDMVVVGKVIAWYDIDTSILLNFPMLKSQTLAFLQQVLLAELAGPVGFAGFLQVTEPPHAGEAEDGGLNHGC